MEEVSVSENKKKPIPKKYFKIAFSLLGFVIFVLLGSYKIGYPVFYLNTSLSAPLGLYMANPFGSYGYGDYVIMSSPRDFHDVKRGSLFLKQVRGLPGDIFVRGEKRLEINGEIYPLFEDSRLPQITRGVYCIAEDSYILLNDTENSFDSRYFGPVEKKYVRQKVVLVFDRQKFWKWEKSVHDVFIKYFG